MVSSVESFDTSFVRKFCGSSSTSPSRLPRILVENHPSKARQRVEIIGAKPLFTSVCPVLKSLPAMGICVRSANCHMAGISTVVFGAPITKGQPSASAA